MISPIHQTWLPYSISDGRSEPVCLSALHLADMLIYIYMLIYSDDIEEELKLNLGAS